MGDKFENINTSTFINKSAVENSFNKVKKNIDSETAKVLQQIADIIQKSNSKDAGEIFDSFIEIIKPKPKKSIQTCWKAITEISNT